MSEPDYTLDHAYDAGHEAGWKHGYDEGRTLGYDEGKKYGYTLGYNEAMRLHQNLDVADWMYGKHQHGKGENP